MGEFVYEDRHKLRPHDFAVLEKFNFAFSPVGFKFINVPEDLEPLGLEQYQGKASWCTMLREAQRGRAFYATAENHSCEPGIFLTGHGPLVPLAAGGRIGPAFDIYPEERANRRVYEHVTKLAEGSTYATAYAPVDKLTFDPDLLIIACDNLEQAERLLRATQWDTGDMIMSRMTYVMGCNWIFTFPYVSGQINTVWTGVCHGMKEHGLYPPGIPIVSIPWPHIDRVLRNIREMPWTLPLLSPDPQVKAEAYRRGNERLGVEGII
ncbi:MAG: DUF169 domain-containing protein [Thermoleophilia bacterium]|nr:DUF169 domain-containing protein [Thermoleophilia bacterium]